MGMTMTQKILAAHAGLDEVKAGQLIMANLDLVLGNDVTSPVAINEFNKAGFTDVFDKNKVTMVMDHFAPNKDIKSATQCKTCRDFASKYDIKNYFDVGDMGIEHVVDTSYKISSKHERSLKNAHNKKLFSFILLSYLCSKLFNRQRKLFLRIKNRYIVH